MTTGGGRDPALTAVRAIAMLVVLAAHAALSFMATPIGWAVRDDARWLGADAGVWIARQFVMPVFFFVGGAAAARLLAQRGVAGFARHRARRLGGPLVLALVPVSLAMNALWDHGRALSARGAVAAAVPHLRGSTLPLTLAHLWFLYYLLLVSAVAVAATLLPRPWGRWIDALVARPVVLAAVAPVPAWLCLVIDGKLQLDTPLGFAIDPLIALSFGSFFAVGWWCAARGLTSSLFARHAPWLALVAVGAIAAVTPALLASRDGGRPPLYATAAAAYGSWALVLALVGGAGRWIRAVPAALARLVDDSLWIYILHLPIVVGLQLIASQLDGPGPIEYVAIVAIALTASAVGARLIGRVAPRG